MYIAIMGYGVVGSGVAELLDKNHESIVSRSTRSSLDIKYILDLRDFPGDAFESKIIKDFNRILNDPEVKIVVETMGGLHPAFDFTLACLKAGKSVVTSNKELVAEKGPELLKAAQENNVNFLFEASVGGGIPIIRPINQCLAANELNEVAGILNGTTNFILTKMIADNMDFADALKLAQENGYAEKDPTADIEGHDACRKICILSALCFGQHVYPKDVSTSGISSITLTDVEYVAGLGGIIKLIGRAKKLDDGKLFVMVSPAVVMRGSQLASVDGVFNAILVRGDAIGDVVFYGKGAGKLPTASAVVADVIDCAKHSKIKRAIGWNDAREGYVSDYLDYAEPFYVRAEAADKAAAEAEVKELFAEAEMLSCKNPPVNEIAFTVPAISQRAFEKTAAKAGHFKLISALRILDY